MTLEKLGPYRIGKQLGRGGMGTVYEATHAETDQQVAVKVLSAALAVEEGFRERFESEIETLRKLRHPNIVRIFGFGEEDGHLFYSMELVRGPSLEDELRTGRCFEWHEVMPIAIEMCRALKHAHDHGVVHRDIKPANIMLTVDGNVKLSDFGIAKLFGAVGLTGVGGVLGTAEYMAPEQTDGRPITHRCDLYSLGSLMYALLAGRPPFQASSLPEMLQLQRFAEPDPVGRFAEDTPAELELVISELLEKDPDSRIANAMVLGRRLEAMYHGLMAREKKSEQSGDDEFTLQSPDESDPNDAQLGPTIATRSPLVHEAPGEDHIETQAVAEDEVKGPVSPGAITSRVEDQFTLAMSDDSSSDDEPPPSDEPVTRFTEVDDDEPLVSSEDDSNASPFGSPQTWGLVTALAMLVAGGWYLMRPASADALYARIVQAADEGGPKRLALLEDDIDDYLARFPNDPRRDEIVDYQQEVELLQLQRKFERRARNRGTGKTLPAVEEAYLEAFASVESNPDHAVAKLQAILDLYDHSAQDESTRRCVELARRQLERLQPRVKASAATHRVAIRRHMARADQLAATAPAEARTIWQAIVELYRDKPWAAEQVAEAEERLREQGHATKVGAAP